MQHRYAACGDSPEAKERVTLTVQRQVVREARLDATQGLDLLRSAVALVPNDDEIVHAAFYLRNNIHVPCPLSLGARVPAVPLAELRDGATSESTTLTELASSADYTVVCAGSTT